MRKSRRRMLFGLLAILASACGSAPTESVSDTLDRAFQVEDNEAIIARSSDGAELELGVYEIDFEEAPNLDRPTSITTTFPDGSVHTFIDVGSRRARVLGNFPALAAGYNKTHLDIWHLRDHFVVDTTDYNGALVVPGSLADVGPMRAGVFTVDAAHFASPAEFTRLVARSEPLDAPAVFDRLPAILTNSSVSEDGGSITATANFAQLSDIFGHDIEDVAGSDAFSIAASEGLPKEPIDEWFVDSYGASTARVEIYLPTEPGDVLTVEYSVDLSDIWRTTFTQGSPVTEDLNLRGHYWSEAGFWNSTRVISRAVSFEFVETASLPAPPEATEDRTEQLLADLVEGST